PSPGQARRAPSPGASSTSASPRKTHSVSAVPIQLQPRPVAANEDHRDRLRHPGRSYYSCPTTIVNQPTAYARGRKPESPPSGGGTATLSPSLRSPFHPLGRFLHTSRAILRIFYRDVTLSEQKGSSKMGGSRIPL